MFGPKGPNHNRHTSVVPDYDDVDDDHNDDGDDNNDDDDNVKCYHNEVARARLPCVLLMLY